MKYDNTPTKFSTASSGASLSETSRGTSRYYVYTNGILRVKFNDGFIHVRRDKNLCLLPRKKDRLIKAKRGDTSFRYGGKTIKFALAMDPHSQYQKFAYGKCPADFLLNEDGTFKGKDHTGDAITPDFKAFVRESADDDWQVVDKAKLDAHIRATYGARHAELTADTGLAEIRDIVDDIT
jgi:hypothetical protein